MIRDDVNQISTAVDTIVNARIAVLKAQAAADAAQTNMDTLLGNLVAKYEAYDSSVASPAPTPTTTTTITTPAAAAQAAPTPISWLRPAVGQ